MVLTIFFSQSLTGFQCLQSQVKSLSLTFQLTPYLHFQSYLLLFWAFHVTRMACFFLLKTYISCTSLFPLSLPTSHPVKQPHHCAKYCGIQSAFPGRTGFSPSSRETGTQRTTLRLHVQGSKCCRTLIRGSKKTLERSHQ